MPTKSSARAPRTAAVIGSGFGGLAIAIRLQAAGVKTVLYEGLDELGGRAGAFNIDGYQFDRGPTVITAPEAIEELFTLAGKRMADYTELLPVSPMYRLLWEDGTRFDYSAGLDELTAEIRRVAPEDEAGYHEFYAYAKQVYDAGYTELCHVPFLQFWDMVKVAPQLLKLKAHVPVYQTVSRYFKNDYLRQVFSFSSLLIGGNPFRASSIYTLIHPLERRWGVTFPKGGTHALVQALGRLFTDCGGEIRLGTPVAEIVTSGSQVTGIRDRQGSVQRFDLVVSNADVTYTYSQLLRGEPAARKTAQSLQGKRHSMSLFLLYFGTRRSYPGLLHHNVMFGARYKDLLKDIFDRGKVADDFSLYLHAPTLTDPSLAPSGCHSFYVLSPVPHLGHGRYDWEQQGEAYAQRIIDYLDERYMPGLRSDIAVQRIFTPLDFASRLNAYQGSAFSLEPTLTQSAYFRVHNRDDKIGGLYFVGAGTHPGAGIPGVIGSAKATAHVILGAAQQGMAEAPTGQLAYGSI